MGITYDKPFKCYNEQIKKLEEDYGLNMFIGKEYIEETLRTLAYYNIVNGYKECFMCNGKFLNDVSIYDIIILNALEKNFLTTLFKYSTYVEEFFKTKMAYTISKNISVDNNIYLKTQYYHISNKRRKKFLDTINKIKNSFTTKDQPTKHYNEHHNHIPPWILFKNVYFNSVIDLFTFFNKSMQLQIVDDYSLIKKLGIKDEFKTKNFKKMLTIVRKFRNKIAHNAKIITYRVENKYEILYQEIKGILPNSFINFKDIRNDIGKTDIFAMIFSIIVLLDNSILRNLFLNEIKGALEGILKSKFSNTYLSLSNIPLNIIDRIESLQQYFK